MFISHVIVSISYIYLYLFEVCRHEYLFFGSNGNKNVVTYRYQQLPFNSVRSLTPSGIKLQYLQLHAVI